MRLHLTSACSLWLLHFYSILMKKYLQIQLVQVSSILHMHVKGEGDDYMECRYSLFYQQQKMAEHPSILEYLPSQTSYKELQGYSLDSAFVAHTIPNKKVPSGQFRSQKRRNLRINDTQCLLSSYANPTSNHGLRKKQIFSSV